MRLSEGYFLFVMLSFKFFFLRTPDAYLTERSVIFKEEMVGGRERVTTDEEWVLRGG